MVRGRLIGGSGLLFDPGELNAVEETFLVL